MVQVCLSIVPLFLKAFKRLIYEHLVSLLEKANVLAYAQYRFIISLSPVGII